MKAWYWLARLLMSVLLLAMVGLGLVASLPYPRPAQAAVLPGNLLYAWGYNAAGQVGDGTTTNRHSPVPISLPNGVTPTAISTGDYHSLAIGTDGLLYTWGSNTAGQLGDGTTTNHNTPELINLPNGDTPTAIAAGGNHNLAISTGGKLFSWGYNFYGAVGDGTITQRNSPVPISLPNGVIPTTIAAGANHSLVIGSDGKIYAWGYNNFGELGDSTSIERNSPVPISLPDGAIPTAIAAGADHSLAIGSNGKLYAWGYNNSGQVGDSSITNRYNPVPITLPNGVIPTAINGGDSHSLAIGSDGKIYAWGDNNFGQLGDGTTTQRNSPVPISLPNAVTPTAIVAGGLYSLAIGSDGKLYAWGDNRYGQLGDGTTTQRNSPSPINLPDGFIPTAIGGGYEHSLVIATPPAITINNVTQNEGNSGTTPFQFTISLSYATSQTVTVQYATADNTATTADNDYQPITGTLTIPPNQITGTITVQVNGDTRVERDESFALNLTNPTGATLGNQATGIATILNDDSGNSCNPLLVTSSGDDGSCGTLRAALSFASANATKTVNVQLSAGSVISLTTGLTLTTGVAITTTAPCGIGPNNTVAPPVTIQGTGSGSGVGLTLAGNNRLYGLWVRGFSGVQIKAPPLSTTKMQCIRASKL